MNECLRSLQLSQHQLPVINQQETVIKKVKVTLEFIPDEPEENKSPLDDVRKEIDGGDR